jgi:hypothetical protein
LTMPLGAFASRAGEYIVAPRRLTSR